MNQQQQQEKLTSDPNLPGRITRQGKIRALYTLKCRFADGNHFTYRSDLNLMNYNKQGYPNISELAPINKISQSTLLPKPLVQPLLNNNRVGNQQRSCWNQQRSCWNQQQQVSKQQAIQ